MRKNTRPKLKFEAGWHNNLSINIIIYTKGSTSSTIFGNALIFCWKGQSLIIDIQGVLNNCIKIPECVMPAYWLLRGFKIQLYK